MSKMFQFFKLNPFIELRCIGFENTYGNFPIHFPTVTGNVMAPTKKKD